MRGSMPHNYEVRDVLKTLEKAGLESRMPAWDKERVIMQEGHKALKDDMASSTRKHLAPCVGGSGVATVGTKIGRGRDPICTPR